ncbi:hypothetical protein BBI08_10005 [Planococcus halocryophilus]|uniref:Uncharacterized protein n=1 Tax=Planococcus halocryophilus TaxID=1215089 RepID=A0A1C7DRM4_9BACL|nr:hypothetical protein BBI08_10005 [Planococcus halocryophilus]
MKFSLTRKYSFKKQLKLTRMQVATPAEKRRAETPQELATRRLSAESAESVHWVRRILYAYKK